MTGDNIFLHRHPSGISRCLAVTFFCIGTRAKKTGSRRGKWHFYQKNCLQNSIWQKCQKLKSVKTKSFLKISRLVYCVKGRFVCAKCEIEIPIKCAYNKCNSYQQSIVIIYYQVLIVRSMNSCKKEKGNGRFRVS